MIGSKISHSEIIETLGGGGTGAVYRARDTTLGRTVALKFLPEDSFDDALVTILRNDTFPRGAVEKSVLLETADMVVPDRVYAVYREIIADPISMVSMETVCANPWTYPNLLKDPRFVADVRTTAGSWTSSNTTG